MKLLIMFLVLGLGMSVQAADEMSLMKFKATNSCNGCDLSGADLSNFELLSANLEGADLSGANFESAEMKNVENLDKAKLCKTIMPWGEDNSGC